MDRQTHTTHTHTQIDTHTHTPHVQTPKTHRRREQKAHRQADRQTDGRTNTHTETKTHTHVVLFLGLTPWRNMTRRAPRGKERGSECMRTLIRGPEEVNTVYLCSLHSCNRWPLQSSKYATLQMVTNSPGSPIQTPFFPRGWEG